MRRDARECVYKILFAKCFNDDVSDDFTEEVFADVNLSEKDREFANGLLNVICENADHINSEISELANGYKLERIYPTDKCALILAFAEMAYFDEVPDIVAIDEVLSLVKKYSTPESLSFVNGILAAYKKKLEMESGENN